MVDEDLSELEKSLEEDLNDVDLGDGAAAPAAPAAAKAPKGGGGDSLTLTPEQNSNLAMLLDLPLKVKVELGRARVLIQDILQYGQGSVVELNKSAGDTLEVTVNNQLIAKGEVVVVNEKFAVRITEIVDAETRIKRLGAAGRDSSRIMNTEEGQGAEVKETAEVTEGEAKAEEATEAKADPKPESEG